MIKAPQAVTQVNCYPFLPESAAPKEDAGPGTGAVGLVDEPGSFAAHPWGGRPQDTGGGADRAGPPSG